LIQDKKRKERELYKSDQRHYSEIRNMSMTQKREDDKDVAKALKIFEEKMVKREENREKILQETSQRAEEHINFVMEKLDKIKNKGEMDAENVKFRANFEKSFKRKIEVSKERERMIAYHKRRTFEKIRQEQERAKANIK